MAGLHHDRGRAAGQLHRRVSARRHEPTRTDVAEAARSGEAGDGRKGKRRTMIYLKDREDLNGTTKRWLMVTEHRQASATRSAEVVAVEATPDDVGGALLALSSAERVKAYAAALEPLDPIKGGDGVREGLERVVKLLGAPGQVEE